MPATYTLADLLSPETAADALDVLLTDLAAQGFPTTAWDDFGVVVGILRSDARALSDLLQLVAIVARGGLVDLSPGTDPGSPGDWLSLLAANYGLTRFEPTFAVARATVAVAATASPYNLAPGGLTIEHVFGSTRYRYTSTNTAPLLIPNGTSAVVEFRAELSGKAHNRILGNLVAPVQSLPGVTVTLLDVGSGSPMVISGVDAERDASLRERMRLRWDTIGLQKTSLALDFLARNAPGVATPITRTRITATNPRGPNTVDIHTATDAGVPTPADVALVRTYVRDRSSIGSDVEVYAGVPLTIAIAATVSAPGFVVAEVQAAVVAALDALILETPIGGTIRWSRIIDALGAEDAGVESVDVAGITVNGTALTADFVLPFSQSVAVPWLHTITVTG